MVKGLARVLKDRRLWVLLLILGVGAYLRLWNIEHLFNAFMDYDEGVYALDGLVFAHGYLPYRDFLLVHPPAYPLLLASVYKIFGYSFFYARYLSVALSLGSIILAYLIGRKLYHPTTGLIAAALFAVSPEMMYSGRRAVQEPLGIFLLLLAVYFIADFFVSQKNNRLLIAGAMLGLTVATKYLFIPAVIAVLLATLLLLMGERFWGRLNKLASASFLTLYFAFLAILYGFLFLLVWVYKLELPIPFFNISEPVSIKLVAIVVLLFLLPAILALLVMQRPRGIIDWWRRLLHVLAEKQVWFLVSGTVAGFVAGTGFFWLRSPYEFLSQTVLMQSARYLMTFPSLELMARVAPLSPHFSKMAYLPMLLALPLALILLKKRDATRGDIFISVAIAVALIFCQSLTARPKYYVSVYPFLVFGLASIFPIHTRFSSASFRFLSPSVKARVLIILATLLIFLSLSTVLLGNYSGYDMVSNITTSDEELVYRQTVDYLETLVPHKVWCINPIYAALSANPNIPLDFDSFALLGMTSQSPEKILKDRIDQGTEYAVLDMWARNIGVGGLKLTEGLVALIREQGQLVQIIAPDSPNYVEVYLLTVAEQ